MHLEKALLAQDWETREELFSNVSRLRSSVPDFADADEELLELSWKVLQKEVELSQENTGLLYDNSDSRHYIDRLVRLISSHTTRDEHTMT